MPPKKKTSQLPSKRGQGRPKVDDLMVNVVVRMRKSMTEWLDQWDRKHSDSGRSAAVRDIVAAKMAEEEKNS